MNKSENLNETELAPEAQVHAGSEGETSVPNAEAEATAQELAQTKEQLAYLAAELENYKRQTARRLDEERARTARRVFEQMLPALDNFGLAMQHAGTAKDVASLKVGLDFVAQQMQSALEGAGLEPIVAVGQPFDPQKHDAIEEIESDQPSGTVAEELQRGYLYNGEVLRPSRVKVAR